MEVVEDSIRLLIAKSKIVNRKTKQGLDSFFIADCQLEPEIEISVLQILLVVYKKAHLMKQLVYQGKPPSLGTQKIQAWVDVISKISLQELQQ